MSAWPIVRSTCTNRPLTKRPISTLQKYWIWSTHESGRFFIATTPETFALTKLSHPTMQLGVGLLLFRPSILPSIHPSIHPSTLPWVHHQLVSNAHFATTCIVHASLSCAFLFRMYISSSLHRALTSYSHSHLVVLFLFSLSSPRQPPILPVHWTKL